MTASLGRMGAAYIDEFNYGSWGVGGGDQENREAIFARARTALVDPPFGEDDIANFLMLAGGNEDAYGTLKSAQEVYVASGLAGLEDHPGRGSLFAQNTAELHGMLDESRAHAIREELKDIEDRTNLANEQRGEWRKNWVSGGMSVAVGGGAALIAGPAAGVVTAVAVPLFMESAGAAVNTAYGTHTLAYLQENEFKNDGQAMADTGDVRAAGLKATRLAVERYAHESGMGPVEAGQLNLDIGSSYDRGQSVIRDKAATQ
jgi:hypothetical protein